MFSLQLDLVASAAKASITVSQLAYISLIVLAVEIRTSYSLMNTYK